MTEARTYMDGYSDGKEWAQADILRTIRELQASLAWITEYIRAAPPELEEAKKWLLVMDNAAGASPVEPNQARELSEALENLIDATEGLMAWQVKNVKVWNNPAYDTAHMRIEQLRAAINAKGR